jgi:hypothetical protein
VRLIYNFVSDALRVDSPFLFLFFFLL